MLYRRFMTKDHFKIFGNICIVSAWCADCEDEALVIQNEFSCCGLPYEQKPISKYVRESEPVQKRKKISKSTKDAILKNQNFKCFYCERHFGKSVFKGNKEIILKINYDHKIPFVYNQNNFNSNMVAACHICNSLKSSMIFNSIESAQVYLKTKWDEKNITDLKSNLGK